MGQLVPGRMITLMVQLLIELFCTMWQEISFVLRSTQRFCQKYECIHLIISISLDVDQCVTVPKILNDTDTFFQYQIFSIPIPVLFSVPNFSDTGSETFFGHQILPIPVPRLFPGTKFFRYHQKNKKILVLGIPRTGTSH